MGRCGRRSRHKAGVWVPEAGRLSGWGPRRSPCPSARLSDLTFSPISVQRARSWLRLQQMDKHLQWTHSR